MRDVIHITCPAVDGQFESPNSPKSRPWASGTLVGWLFVQAPMVGHDGTDCRCQSDSACPIPRAWGHPPEDGIRRGVGHFVGPDLSVRPQPLRAEVCPGGCPRPPASGAPRISACQESPRSSTTPPLAERAQEGSTNTLYLSLEGGGVESFGLFTGEQIGDSGITDDEVVVDYFERLLGGLGPASIRRCAMAAQSSPGGWD